MADCDTGIPNALEKASNFYFINDKDTEPQSQALEQLQRKEVTEPEWPSCSTDLKPFSKSMKALEDSCKIDAPHLT